MKKKEWTDIPPDVHEGIRRARRFLLLLAWDLSKVECTDDTGRLTHLAMHCDNEAEWLDDLLARYQLPSEVLPPLNYDETEEERLEWQLSRRIRRK